jgi:hypothetical protein
VAKLKIGGKSGAKRRRLHFWERRFSLNLVAPFPHQAEPEESRGEQRQAGRLWDRVSGYDSDGATALERKV